MAISDNMTIQNFILVTCPGVGLFLFFVFLFYIFVLIKCNKCFIQRCKLIIKKN